MKSPFARLALLAGWTVICCIAASLSAPGTPPTRGDAPPISPATPPATLPPPLTFPPLKGEALILCAAAVDGDTVDFYWLVKDRARLYGVNAPEVEGPTKPAGLASKAALAKLLPATPTRAVLHGREKYGRALLVLFDGSGKDVGQVLVDGGFAKAWDGKGPRP